MIHRTLDFTQSRRSLQNSSSYLAVAQEWTAEAGLKLHPEKRKIVDAKETSFDFLGYRFERGRRYPRTKSLTKFKDAIRAATKRTSRGCAAGLSVSNINGQKCLALASWCARTGV